MKNKSDQHKQVLTIVYIEDNPGDRFLLTELLSVSRMFLFDIKATSDLDSAEKLLEELTPDVVLLDLELADTKDRETIDRAVGIFKDIPLLIVSASRGLDISYYASTRGILDYLVKGEDFRTEKLIRAILMAKVRWDIDREKVNMIKKELQDSLEKLESASYLLSQQVYTFSHQIRGPLCTIEGLMNLLDVSSSDKAQVDLLEYLRSTFDLLKSEVDHTIRGLEGQVSQASYRGNDNLLNNRME